MKVVIRTMQFRRILTIIFLLTVTGCATLAPYRGDNVLEREIDAAPSNVYRAIANHAIDNSFRVEDANVELGYVLLQYRFPNAQTFRGATRAVSPYADPIGSSINPYGQNPYVVLTLRITPIGPEQTQLKIISRFETYGVPHGVGGIGPFQMNSKGIWEEAYVEQIATISTQLKNRGDLGVSDAVPTTVISGTGFFVSRDGQIITNAHVVDSCNRLVVTLPDGSTTSASVTALDEHNDIAAIKISKLASHWARFNQNALTRAGDNAVAFGFPLSGDLSSLGNVTAGNVSALSGLKDDPRYYQITAPVQPGNSGGPLLDEKGNVIGIITAKLDALEVARSTGDIPQNINFSLKATLAKAFMSINSITFETSAARSALSTADIGDIGRSISVKLDCYK